MSDCVTYGGWNWQCLKCARTCVEWSEAYLIYGTNRLDLSAFNKSIIHRAGALDAAKCDSSAHLEAIEIAKRPQF